MMSTANDSRSSGSGIDIKNTHWRDEWDFWVQLALRREKKKDVFQALTDKDGNPSDRTMQTWVKPNAGLFLASQPEGSIELIGRLSRWLTSASGSRPPLANDQIESERHAFFRSFRSHNFDRISFVGREEELADIEKLFHQPGQSVCLTSAALSGIGGQGKTAIARQYFQTHLSDYAASIWIDRQSESIRAALLRITKDLPAPEWKNEDWTPTGMAFAKLATCYRGKMLIVIDDLHPGENSRAEREIKKVSEAIPKTLKARVHLLMTCRRKLSLKQITPKEIEKMNEPDSIKLFKTRAEWVEERGSDDEISALVIGMLGGHALSIELVAAYAHANSHLGIDELIETFNGQIVDSKALEGLEAEGYEESLYKAYRLSYDSIDQVSQLALLMFGLFRRAKISLKTVAAAVKEVQANYPEFTDLWGEFLRSKGTSRALNQLTQFSLVERYDELKRVPQIRLHEVIYDFVQVEWTQLVSKVSGDLRLDELETAITEGCAHFASRTIESDQITFKDVETVTGLLLPSINLQRNFIPSERRISIALEFWWDNFKFQDYVYATGLQELLLAQLLPLRDYLKEARYLRAHPKHDLILHKLIGHAYYANPKETGPQAEVSFHRAESLLDEIDPDTQDEETRLQLPIYRLFFLDHIANVKSKNRSIDVQTIPVTSDPEIEPILHQIEQSLPSTLRELPQQRPSSEDCRLLVRAMHYWGHRGNQDSFTLLSRFEHGHFGEPIQLLGDKAFDSYLKALSFRMLEVRLARRSLYDRYIAALYRRNRLAFYPDWIQTAEASKDRAGFEGCTSLAQALGDAAHQYRCIHLVRTLQYLDCRKTGASNLPLRLHDARVAFDSANTLWQVSIERCSDGEVPLKFKVWMAGSEILNQLTNLLESGGATPQLEKAVFELQSRVTQLQSELQVPYLFGAQQQENELKAIWAGMEL